MHCQITRSKKRTKSIRMASRLTVEHLVLRALGRGNNQPERWLLAVSGGADSMVMAEILFRWRRYLGVELALAHVHHGRGRAERQNTYRDQAQALVSEWATRRNLEFFTNLPSREAGVSEQDLREFRRSHLRGWLKAGAFSRVAFAHHRDDLLETRLLRLIRGSGRQGLKAMAVKRGRILRPLLHLSRAQIVEYATFQQVKWMDDPSNELTTSLRNWLRQDWIPQLERRSPGAAKSLSRSLTTLAQNQFTETIGPFVGLRRAALEEFTPVLLEDVVARYLRTIGMKGYSQTHVQELLKRLSTRRQPVRFEMLGFSFQATADFLWASRV